MNDPRPRSHELGFLQAVEVLSPEALKAYYADRYYQMGQGNYRRSYPPREQEPVRALETLRRLIADRVVLVVTAQNEGSLYQESPLENGNISERFRIALLDHLAHFTHGSFKRPAETSDRLYRGTVGDLYPLAEGSEYVRTCRSVPQHIRRDKFELMLGREIPMSPYPP